MKFHVHLATGVGEGFDLTCTHFDFSPHTGFIYCWNGCLDTPHSFDASNFIEIRFINSEEAGIKFVCYNNISAALKDYDIKEEVYNYGF